MPSSTSDQQNLAGPPNRSTSRLGTPPAACPTESPGGTVIPVVDEQSALGSTPEVSGEKRRPVLLPMALVVLAFIAAGHAWSLDTGLFLDDHAHFANLRQADWSFRGAVEASRLGIVGDVMDLWGRHESGLRFFRPVAFWLMKAEYTLAGWRPMPMHAFSLAWHFTCSMLVGILALRCFGRPLWAVVAAAVMAIHPAHTATVYWIACQTELMATAFLLIGILAYARHAGWHRPYFLQPQEKGGTPGRNQESPPESHPVPFLAVMAVVCYALALGCRENAVLFPLACLAGDRLFGTKHRRVIRWEHVLLLSVFGAYMAARWVFLGGFPLPARPYIMPVSDPGFAAYIVDKVVYYTLGLFSYIPVIPMGGQAWFASRPLAFYGGFAAAGAILLVIWGAFGFRRALLWPVAWMGCFIAPVLPVFASSHHLYLPGVGAALLLAAGLGALGGLTLPPGTVLPAPRVVLTGLVLVLHAVGLGLLTWAGGFAYRTGTQTENILIDDVLTRGRPIRSGDHLFFINLPVLAYYAIPAIEARTGLTDLHGHVLTFNPWLLRMEDPAEVEIPDRHRIRVRAPRGARYFEGVMGRTLLEAMGINGLSPGDTFRAEQYAFTVNVVAMDDDGVQELEFVFDAPIDSPNYHFYFGSPHFLAYPLPLKPQTYDDQ